MWLLLALSCLFLLIEPSFCQATGTFFVCRTLLLFSLCLAAKRILYEVTEGDFQVFSVGEGGVATLFYQYTGLRNDITRFDWVILSPPPMGTAAIFPESPMTPPLSGYSALGNVSRGYTNLLIDPVKASMNGTVYLCGVRFIFANNHLSKNTTMLIKGLLIHSCYK